MHLKIWPRCIWNFPQSARRAPNLWESLIMQNKYHLNRIRTFFNSLDTLCCNFTKIHENDKKQRNDRTTVCGTTTDKKQPTPFLWKHLRVQIWQSSQHTSIHPAFCSWCRMLKNAAMPFGAKKKKSPVKTVSECRLPLSIHFEHYFTFYILFSESTWLIRCGLALAQLTGSWNVLLYMYVYS